MFDPGRVRSAISASGKFPTKIPNFKFLPSGQKISLGQVKKYQGLSWVELCIAAGQVCLDRARSRPISCHWVVCRVGECRD